MTPPFGPHGSAFDGGMGAVRLAQYSLRYQKYSDQPDCISDLFLLRDNLCRSDKNFQTKERCFGHQHYRLSAIFCGEPYPRFDYDKLHTFRRQSLGDRRYMPSVTVSTPHCGKMPDVCRNSLSVSHPPTCTGVSYAGCTKKRPGTFRSRSLQCQYSSFLYTILFHVFPGGDIGTDQRFNISCFVWHAFQFIYDVLFRRGKTRKRILLFVLCGISVLWRLFFI